MRHTITYDALASKYYSGTYRVIVEVIIDSCLYIVTSYKDEQEWKVIVDVESVLPIERIIFNTFDEAFKAICEREEKFL